MNLRDLELLEKLMSLPTAEVIETVATREVDELLKELHRQGLKEYLDPNTIRLIRAVMIASYQRGAGYMAESIGRIVKLNS